MAKAIAKTKEKTKAKLNATPQQVSERSSNTGVEIGRAHV